MPIRVRDKNYIGVLDAPTIKIRATSPADLDAQNIRFDNVILPWDIDAEKIYRPATEKIYRPIASTPSRANDELRDTFEVIFGTRDVWSIIADYGRPLTNPSPAQKKFLLKMICGDGYTERDLIHLRVTDNFSAGWALTREALSDGKFFRQTESLHGRRLPDSVAGDVRRN